MHGANLYRPATADPPAHAEALVGAADSPLPAPYTDESGVRATPSRTEGWFGPRSAVRTVLRESAGLLGGGRALLLQLAHPMIAAGVAEHSAFRADPLGRLERTLDMTLTMVFGDQDQADGALRAFHAVHARVRGRLPHAAGPFPAGTPYTAHDPFLKLWVHATLIDSALLVYQRFVRPLSPGDRTRFYEDSKLLARQVGIPDPIIPATLADFRRYMSGMLASDALTVTPTARSLAHDVLDPPISLVPRTGARVAGFVTAGLLPARVRRAYGLTWDGRRELVLDALAGAVRLVLPLVPDSLRLMPHARSAEQRLRREPVVAARFPRWLGLSSPRPPVPATVEPPPCTDERSAENERG